ncbi:hypothetical protein DSM106972_087540 [Dulcicalothrix desertica PCC 7102]|uniref:YhcG N-terminal domain-containing protein n=1 Tax=Dulcicalothrix desertica PCC 7102 TaxID=232991 RepID=A0A3S1C4Q5_9CYAN|nr:DUF1016 N-terminal domain-containing protein [Dulcicalothrix desertica]RUS96567.1 hypothetical protein DSM106972_087540 [Dulcicalothrix desertica PCC 7102]TWH51407.1 uncharacterized protein DUF1016 [Dulcicalothrix desertica PCC 7102]
MSNDLTQPSQPSNLLFQEIRQLIDTAKQRAAVAVNAEITLLYWQVGKRIQTEVLQGQRAEYDKLNCKRRLHLLAGDSKLYIKGRQSRGSAWIYERVGRCAMF